LDGDKPNLLLSGTDSSTLAGMIRLASGKTAATLLHWLRRPGLTRMEYARLAAKHFKTEHHECYVTPDDLVQGIARWQYYDNRLATRLPAYYCAMMARETA
jgi:asparagine synthase (glutamine-hydrolysing)